MSNRKNKYSSSKSRKKSMLPKVILIIFFGVILINIFDDDNPSQQTGSSNGQNTNNQQSGNRSVTMSDQYRQVTELAAASSLYALHPLKDSWPLAANEDDNIGGQSDLLTKNYYIVLDGSGSMRKAECSDGRQKLDVAIEALQLFARSLPSDSNFGLAVFRSGQIKEITPLSPAKHDIRIPTFQPEGSTPLKSSIGFAYERITQQAKKQLGYGEYNLVVITDGQASEGQNPTGVVNAMLQESPVILQTIGFCIGINHILNQPDRSDYKAANSSAELQRGLKEVLAESTDFRVDSF